MTDDRFGGGGRGGEAASIEYLRDCGAALRGLRAARGIFSLLIVAAVLMHVGAFIAVERDHELCPPAYTPMTDESTAWTTAVQLGLPTARLVGLVSAVLLALCFLLAAQVCLAARIPGVGGTVAATMWALLLVVLILPWRDWLGADGLWSAFITTADLQVFVAEPHIGTSRHIAAYLRFVGYPLLALIALLFAWLRFSSGYNPARRHLMVRMDSRNAG